MTDKDDARDVDNWIQCFHCGSDRAVLKANPEWGGREQFVGYSFDLHCPDCGEIELDIDISR